MQLKRYHVILGLIGLVIAIGQSDMEEEQRQADQYCEMVKMWKDSNGEKGWPAYNGEGMCR